MIKRACHVGRELCFPLLRLSSGLDYPYPSWIFILRLLSALRQSMFYCQLSFHRNGPNYANVRRKCKCIPDQAAKITTHKRVFIFCNKHLIFSIQRWSDILFIQCMAYLNVLGTFFSVDARLHHIRPQTYTCWGNKHGSGKWRSELNHVSCLHIFNKYMKGCCAGTYGYVKNVSCKYGLLCGQKARIKINFMHDIHLNLNV